MRVLRESVPSGLAFENTNAGSGKFAFAMMKVSELHGAFKKTLYNYLGDHAEVCVAGVSPATLKKYATGSGRAEKSDVKLSIFKEWQETFKNNNEADAYVLARIAREISMGLAPKYKYQRECMKKIKKGY